MQNQNQNDFIDIDRQIDELNQVERPAVVPREAVANEFDLKIDDATPKTDLKDLEISFNFEKIELIKKLLDEVQNNLRRICCLLGEDNPQIAEKIKRNFVESEILSKEVEAAPVIDKDYKSLIYTDVAFGESGERIIEGVFNGQNMVGADGKEYRVPVNYASKSKLVEGDILKLTINARGNFIFKQIGPIERARVIGILEQSETGNGFSVVAGKKRWKVLTASVTFFKGEPGDEAVILIPKNTPSKWAAVENVIRRVEAQ